MLCERSERADKKLDKLPRGGPRAALALTRALCARRARPPEVAEKAALRA